MRILLGLDTWYLRNLNLAYGMFGSSRRISTWVGTTQKPNFDLLYESQ
jgi:hypothetical protein